MRKVVRKRVRRTEGGVNIVGDVNAVVASSSPEAGGASASARQRVRIVQRNGQTLVTEEHVERTTGDAWTSDR